MKKEDNPVFIEQVKMLYSHSRIALLGHFFSALLTTILLWPSSRHDLLILWLTLQLLAAMLRGFLAIRFNILLKSGRIIRFRHWAWASALGSLMHGIIWAYLAWIIMLPDVLSNALIISLVSSGMVASSIGASAVFFPAYLCFVVPLGAAISLRFMLEGGSMIAIGLLMMFYIIVNSSFALSLLKVIQASIARGFEREELLADVQKKQQEAEHANRDKSRFLAAVSHDLRQPLHALELFHASLKSKLNKPEQKDILGLASHSSRALGEMLGELMDISCLDAGNTKPELRITPLVSLLRECADEVQPLAYEKGLRLRLRLPRERYVNSDPILLKRILRNLLSNAIRHTESGGVLLGTRMRDGRLHIKVYDTGSGICETQLPYIFDEFYQINNPERDRDKGLGLGLSIVRRVADILDHDIHVHSQLSKGSCFTVTVPLCTTVEQHPQEAVVQPTVDTKVAGLFVLVVDDDRAILQAMRKLLLGWGCEVLLAESAEGLLNELTTHNYPPADILLSDYRLRGGHTGLELGTAIKAHFPHEIPTLIISGDIHPDVQSKVRNAGYQWLEKPVQDEVLKRQISNLAALRRR